MRKKELLTREEDFDHRVTVYLKTRPQKVVDAIFNNVKGVSKSSSKSTCNRKPASDKSNTKKKKLKKDVKTIPKTLQSKKGTLITRSSILHGSSVQLKITASHEDWKKLYEHISNREKDFPFDFLGSFVIPAIEDSLEELSLPEIGPHGAQLNYYKKKHNQLFIDSIKIQSALLYNHFQDAMKKKRRDERIEQVEKVVRKVFSNYYKGYKIKIPSSNFWLKYIYPGLRLLKSKSPEALDKIYNLWAFHNYLHSHQLIKKKYQHYLNLLSSLTNIYLSQHSFLFKTTT